MARAYRGTKQLILTGFEELFEKLEKLGGNAAFAIAAQAAQAGGERLRQASPKPPENYHGQYYHPGRQRGPSSQRRVDFLRARAKKLRTAEIVAGWPEWLWYLNFLETGTDAHQIRGRWAGGKTLGIRRFGGREKLSGNHPLVFRGRRGIVVDTEVNHPGTNPLPQLRPAMSDSSRRAAILDAVEEKARVVLAELAGGLGS